MRSEQEIRDMLREVRGTVEQAKESPWSRSLEGAAAIAKGIGVIAGLKWVLGEDIEEEGERE